MSTLNHIVLIGRLGASPELRYTNNGKPVCSFRIATNRWRSDTNAEETDWHNVKVLGRSAESSSRFLQRGSQVAVEGHLENRQFEGRDGQRKYWTEVVARRVCFLGSKRDEETVPLAAVAGAPAIGLGAAPAGYGSTATRPAFGSGSTHQAYGSGPAGPGTEARAAAPTCEAPTSASGAPAAPAASSDAQREMADDLPF